MLGSVLLQAAGTAHESFLQFLGENLELFLTYTGVYNATPGHLIMILVGLLFIFWLLNMNSSLCSLSLSDSVS